MMSKEAFERLIEGKGDGIGKKSGELIEQATLISLGGGVIACALGVLLTMIGGPI